MCQKIALVATLGGDSRSESRAPRLRSSKPRAIESGANSWTVIATNKLDAQGRFSVGVPLLPDSLQAFYKLALRMPTPAEALPRTVALFKTPSVRDLGHSGPYLHTGRMDSLEDVVQFYITFSRKARQGGVRNADPELKEIRLNQSAIAPLAAFLRSLNEDYTD